MGGRLPSGSPSFRDPIGRKRPLPKQLTTAPRPLLEGEPEPVRSQELTAKLMAAGPPIQRARGRRRPQHSAPVDRYKRVAGSAAGLGYDPQVRLGRPPAVRE